MCVRKLQPNSCSSCSEQTEQQVPPQSAPSPAVDLLGYFTTSVIYEGVCAGRLEDADLPSRSHSDGLKKTRNCWDSGGNQQPGHHSDVISQCPCKPQIRVFKRVTCEVKVSTKCHIIVHITCSSSSSSAGDRSSRQIPAVTRRQKT